MQLVVEQRDETVLKVKAPGIIVEGEDIYGVNTDVVAGGCGSLQRGDQQGGAQPFALLRLIDGEFGEVDGGDGIARKAALDVIGNVIELDGPVARVK